MKYVYSTFLMFLFLAPLQSQSRDTCLSAGAVDTLVASIQEVVRRNVLLDRTVSDFMDQNVVLKNEITVLLSILSGHEELHDRSEATINELQKVLNKTEKKLRREKGLRWLWAGVGAGVVVGIVSLVK